MPLTQAGARDALRETSEEHWLHLVEITHPTIPSSALFYPDPTSSVALDTRENTLRLVSNVEPIVANHGLGARTYHPAVMEPTWVEQSEDRPPRAGLKLAFAVSVIKELREVTTPPDFLVSLKRIIASAPDDIQGRILNGIVRVIDYDSLNLDLELLPPEINAAQPRHLFTPSLFPQLHGVTLGA